METDTQAASAVVFPGMSPSRFDDVAKFMVMNKFARKLIAEADEVLGYSLVDRYREADGDDYSEYAQVAFLVNCLALAQWAEEALDLTPDLCAGPSFGGKAAAVYSGSLRFSDAVLMTVQLARCMDEYFSREHTDIVTHSFVRTPYERLQEILQELDEQQEWHDISCYIDDDFYMLSLRESKVEWLDQRLRSMGGMPLYTMRPPMHSAAFGPLREKVDNEVISGIRFADPALPVIADQDGTVVNTGEGVRRMLLNGFVQPVRWPEIVSRLREVNVGTLYISGQDSLFGRVGCTTNNFEVVPINPRLAMQPRKRRAAV